MNQDHVLLVFKFPEMEDEYTMPYTSDQIDEAKKDAAAFSDMYPGVLFVYIVFVFQDGREEELFRWTNPLAEKLISLINSVGAAPIPRLTTSAFVDPVGYFFRKLSRMFSDSRLALRPPLVEQFASPLPTTSTAYGGRNKSTRRGLKRLR